MAQRIGVLKSEVQGVRRKTQEIKVGRHVAVKRTYLPNAVSDVAGGGSMTDHIREIESLTWGAGDNRIQ